MRISVRTIKNALELVSRAFLTTLMVNEANAQTQCEALATHVLPGARVVSATEIPSGRFQAPDGQDYDVGSFCRVHAIAKPTSDSEIHFEVWLPSVENWNGRYYQFGQGSGGGSISYAALAAFVKEGAVGAATDDGYALTIKNGEDDEEALQKRSWPQSHPDIIVDMRYRALMETTKNAKQLVNAYYGQMPRRSYFEGCSGGGMYAWQAAQHSPEEWDGFLIGAPDNNVTGYFAALAWNSRRWFDPKARILTTKLPAIQRAALASCGPEAHVFNGIAADPRFCYFDPSILLCKGREADDCLTRPEVATLQEIYNGPRNPRTGEQIYPGFPPTLETAWATDSKDSKPTVFYDNTVFYRYVFNNRRWDPRMLNFDSDIAFAENKMIGDQNLKAVFNVTNPDLSSLQKRGAKILMYFGWGDEALTPLEGIAFYESIASSTGGITATQNFFRLFMVPGMYHCGGGPGANSFGQHVLTSHALRNDPAHSAERALEAWVETGRKPDQIMAVKYVDDDPTKGIAFTRPLCPYPQVALYKGQGDVTDGVNFECKTTESHSVASMYEHH